MDEEQIIPGDNTELPEADEPSVSLADTVAEEFGFGDGEAPDDEPPSTVEAPADGAPEAAAPAAAPAAEPVKADPNAELYAPLPEHNPRKTHERFQKLVEGHKEEVTKREAAETERDQFKGQIAQYEAGLQPLREMGFTDQAAVADLQQFSSYRKALASGNVDGAIGILQQQLNQLQLASGRRVDTNPLAGFPDIAERVRVGELDEGTALELARSRHGAQQQRETFQRSQQAEQQHSQQMQSIHEGAAQVTAAVQALQQDIDFAAVLPALEKQLAHIKASYAPHQWAGEIRRTFDYEKRLLAAQARPAAVTRQQPLRGNGHVGGQPAPRSAADAAMQALGFE